MLHTELRNLIMLVFSLPHFDAIHENDVNTALI